MTSSDPTFAEVIDRPGRHPYYCIPHGGPGGFGMSGVIRAQPRPSGLGIFNLSKDRKMLWVNVLWYGLDTVTGVHFHYGAPGVNGPVAIGLTSHVAGNMIMARLDVSITPGLVDSLMQGKVYINVHTTAHPGGEIRGQVWRPGGLGFDGWATGMQEVPPVATNGKGLASARLNYSLDTLWVNVLFDRLSGPVTGAHFHHAMPGANGPVAINLTPLVQGKWIRGFVTGATLTPMVISQFLKGEMYLNIHTTAHAPGEIRSQMYRVAREGFCFQLCGAQEVPPVATQGTGVGAVSLDRYDENLCYLIGVTNLSDTLSAAHIHYGLTSTNGPVLFNLTPYFVNGVARGAWHSTSSPPFTPAMGARVENDSTYVNVHTANFPGGEIRGQITKHGLPCPRPSVCGPVMNPHVTRVAPTSARLNWDALLAADAYEIRGRTSNSGNYVYLNIPNGNTSFKDVFGLQDGRTYVWQIRAFCTGGADTSVWTALDTFTTGCQMPDSAWTGPVSSTGVRFNWTKVFSSVGYQIQGRVSGASNWSTLDIPGGNTTSKDVFGLSSGTTYEWHMRAACSVSPFYKSGWTAIQTFTTGGSRLAGALSALLIYPNPMQLSSVISFSNPEAASWRLILRDVSGQTVQTRPDITDEQITLERGELPAGLYLLELHGPGQVLRGKVLME